MPRNVGRLDSYSNKTKHILHLAHIMTYSALWFSQMQFFGSLGFMAIFFAISFGLSWILFYLRVRAIGEQHLLWLPVYRFWVRIFALAFLLSFASSMPVLIQLGSLWPQLLPKIQEVSSPLLALALVGALVFKAGFLGLMLFAKRQLAEWLHALIILCVALGNTFVAFCLLVLVSWTHTPTGVDWVEGRYQLLQWVEVIANPSLFWYAVLFVAVSFMMVALLMMSILALQSIRRPLGEGERRVFKIALYLGTAAWVGLLVGSVGNGKMVALYQPVKAAAAMAYWQSDSIPSWLWAAWPVVQDMSNHFGLGLENTGLIWLGRDEGGVLLGLDQVAGMSPPVALVFWSLRIAMLAGLLILVVLIKGWRLGVVRHYDPSALSLVGRRVLAASGLLGPCLLLSGMAYQLFGVMPFVVSQTITINEVYAQHSLGQSLTGFFVYLLVYGVFALGFISLVLYTARYGVVSVARRRGRA